MNVWGLHIFDVGIIILYVGLILWIGKRAGESYSFRAGLTGKILKVM